MTELGAETLTERTAYDQLQAYTLGLGDAEFIHQHVVDAWGAQHARSDGKPIGLVFALAGLYLHLELGFSGRQVQRAHMRMAQTRVAWPRFPVPNERGEVTAVHVMRALPGAARNAAIDEWCASVWNVYATSHEAVAVLLDGHGIDRRNPHR